MTASEQAAREWKERAALKAAQRAAQSPPVPVTFGGFNGKAHRLYLLDWARAGRLPQYLASAMFAAARGKATETRREELTEDETLEWMRFQCVAFCSMMDEPRFTTKPQEECAEDELNYGDFLAMCPEVINEAVQWQLNGCPDIPVQAEGGEMTLEELENFRDGGGWLTSPESFYTSKDIFWQTVPTPRIM